jgi:hypothetical protein
MKSLFWGAILIVAGLSGEFVLTGSDSSGALVVVGLIIVGWGVMKISKERKNDRKLLEIYNEHIKDKEEV